MIKIMLLKDENLTTISGQKELISKVENETKDCIIFSNKGCATGDIITIGNDEVGIENALVKDLFLGAEEFHYRFTFWEVEMNEENPTQEQIIQYIKAKQPKLSDNSIKEYIQYSSFHDMVGLRWINADRAKEICSQLTDKTIFEEVERLEGEMKKIGILFEDWRTAEDKEMVNTLLSYAKTAAENGTGIIYANFYELEQY